MTERTTTDIILDLKQEVENLSSEVKNMSFSIKLLLDRTNTILQNQKSSVQETKPQEEIVFPAVPQKKKQIKEIVLDKRKEELPNKKSNYKEVNVSQKVVYPDGTPVILAGVRIFDANKNDITKSLTGKDLIRTVTSGKWNIAIPPGDYFVQIQKEANASKPAFEQTVQFNVSGIDGSLILEVPKNDK
jgi:hypothetical protein